ncbi:MAG: amidohydrolase family protein [Cyclobacteriaceae bacterium]
MEIFDAHHHLWNYQPERFPWINEEMARLKKDFKPIMLEREFKQHGISGSIVVQAIQDEDENHFLLQQADENDFIKGIIGWLDLKSPALRERLNLYVPFQKLKGFRHILQDESDPDFILNAEFQRGLGWLFEAGYVYDLLVFPHQLKGAIKTVENFPDAPFVLDHMAKPSIKSGKMGEWKELIKALGENKNVYCKVSGMVTEANWNNWEENDFFPYLDVVMEAFGEDRLMYGSDWPVCLLAGSYNQIFDIIKKYLNNFPADTQAKIWAKNASVFYRI